MKKLTFAAIALILSAGMAAGADDCPPLLYETPLPAPSVGVCPPPPAPVCEPAPSVCAAPAPAPRAKAAACAAEEYTIVEVPVKKVVNQVETVPVTKKVWVEEVYTDTETRYQTVDEVRVRTRTRKVPVESTRIAHSARLTRVRTCGDDLVPRLHRAIVKKEVPVTIHVTEEYEEPYVVPVKHSYTMPVQKTRKVAREVEELKTVTVPVTVTVMESRAKRK